MRFLLFQQHFNGKLECEANLKYVLKVPLKQLPYMIETSKGYSRDLVLNFHKFGGLTREGSKSWVKFQRHQILQFP